MSVLVRSACVLLLSQALIGCASAGDRLEQGMELEMQGRFDAAVVRYVEALEKDPNMVEARERLLEAGDSAIAGHLAASDAAASGGDAVSAADHYRRIDGLVSRARTVGVRLPVPLNYSDLRGDAFHRATESFLTEGFDAGERGRWDLAVAAFQRARDEFDPTEEQRQAALTGESQALLDWSVSDLEAGRLQAAYGRAARVRGLGRIPPQMAVEADRVMEEALARGRVEVMILPAVAGGPPQGPVPDPALMDLEIRVNDLLAQGPLQAPPPFISLTDDYAVRDVVREASILGTGLGPAAIGLLMRLVEADYGAWMELLAVEVTEYDVDQSRRSVRTRDGRTTSYVLEVGERRMRTEARVIVVDGMGNRVADATVVGTGVGEFRRGLYDGNVADLNLDRREIDYFDRLVMEAQDAAIRQALALDLADRLGVAVFDPILARIP